MSQNVYQIKSKFNNYELMFGNNNLLPNLQNNYIPVVDENIWRIYGKKLSNQLIDSAVFKLGISEKNKSLSTVEKIYKHLIEWGANRHTTLVAIGGGTTQDIAGYVASTFYRGISWIYIPTTLLAQADSCVGGKTSLNFLRYKNLIGTFYPPSKIYVTTKYLQSLSKLDFFSGIGEIIKLHLIGGKRYVEKLHINLSDLKQRNEKVAVSSIQDSLEIKISYIEMDEFDYGQRRLLNFGHCFGHALEFSSNYKISHGQAVILGILLANIVSIERGILDKKISNYLSEQILFPSLITNLKKQYFNEQKILRAMKLDKKRTGKKLVLIALNSKFKLFEFNDVEEREITTAISIFMNYLRSYDSNKDKN